jgi:hypothetical protein
MEKDRGTPIFTTGHLQGYNLSMRGGTDFVRYFLSGDWEDNVGIVDYNFAQRLSLRANIGIVPSEQLSMDFSMGYTDGLTGYMQQMAAGGVMEQAYWATPATQNTRTRGFLRWTPEDAATTEATRSYVRFIGSGTITYRPFSWFTHRLVFGTDVGNDENIVLYPRHPEGANYVFGSLSLGDKTVERPRNRYNTLDYSTSVNYSLTEGIGFTSSLGMQYYSADLVELRSTGRLFPSPVITSLAGAATTTASEVHEANKSFGAYFQQDFNFRDRIFLTAAVRGDDNSAFGSEYDAAIYPKFSAAWVVTDESFWSIDQISSLRLRSAWGKAGRQPSTFASVTLYAPQTGGGGSSAVWPSIKGNPDVGPEVSTELELGFDLSVLEDRVTSEVTYYTRNVDDMLMNVSVPSSAGFGGSQSVNLGRMKNWGYEVRVDARVLERPSYSLDMGFSFSHTDNRVEDLGGNPQTTTLREGWRYPSAFYRRPLSGEWDQFDRPVNLMCDGGRDVVDGYGLQGGDPVPCAQAPRVYFGDLGLSPSEASFDVGVTLFQNLRLTALAEWRSSVIIQSGTFHCRFWCYPNAPSVLLRGAPDGDPVVIACAVERTCGEGADNAVWSVPGAFVKLREISASYSFPDPMVARFGLTRASVTVGARNIWDIWSEEKWTPYAWTPGKRGDIPIQDPDSRGPGDLDAGPSHGSMPGLATVSVTMRVSF